MLRKQFVLTLITLAILGAAAVVAIMIAKGYRVSPKEGTIFGTGILSITSTPDQASVYLDGHLTTATNANINSLEPKKYKVRIIKDGFIPWEKEVEVRQGLVSDIKAALFPAIPSVYPLSFNSVSQVVLSPDTQRFVFVVPTSAETENPAQSAKKNGIWVWDMSDRPVTFTRGREPHQILPGNSGIDLTQAVLKWSPDSNQVLVTLPNQYFMLDANRLNDTPRDVTPIIKATLKSWEEEEKLSNTARLEALKDLNVRRTASDSAFLKWSPDETKIVHSKDGKTQFKVTDLIDSKTYDLPEAKSYSWLASSRHLVAVEADNQLDSLVSGKISIVEFDGGNKSVIFAGSLDSNAVISWSDGSRLLIVSSVPTPTGNKPNLFGINLK